MVSQIWHNSHQYHPERREAEIGNCISLPVSLLTAQQGEMHWPCPVSKGVWEWELRGAFQDKRLKVIPRVGRVGCRVWTSIYAGSKPPSSCCEAVSSFCMLRFRPCLIWWLNPSRPVGGGLCPYHREVEKLFLPCRSAAAALILALDTAQAMPTFLFQHKSFSHFRLLPGHKQRNWNGRQNCLHYLNCCFSFFPYGHG